MLDPYKIIEKYYTKGSEAYHILVTHSEQVRDKALDIAKRHPELNLDVDFISEASMLHDIGIFKVHSPRLHCHGTHRYIEHGYLGSDLLRAEGFPRHALACERHTGVGLSKEMIIKEELPLPLRDMMPETMEEIVICYADTFFSKTKLTEAHSVETVRLKIGRFGEDHIGVFDKWHEMFK